ncbi:hypothetical protein FRB94_007010 [Tulasnella sp. JGI-2019a]|nr:hypothetical protein FRB94_007010 [Tulasnella sp. JGI-2019a]KAG9016924.1 hypothetical protein FRB93_009454 [Tulasnella sp. JGI-2019a]KAG9040181.1 hypothetical protein FRB95_000110 [Tulasnella sp. JGI-2019a]
MSRLASLYGPSSPSSSPARSPPVKSSPGKARRSASAALYDREEPNTTPPTESTYHRKLRTYLLELRQATKTWNDLVLLDGLKAAKGTIDARTELDNSLAALPSGTQPRLRLVNPKLVVIDSKVDNLREVVSKLNKQFQKMASVIESAELLMFDACKSKGVTWTYTEPLWTTWPLERFVSRLPALLPSYHRALETCIEISEKLSSNSLTFEESRTALRQWVAQPCLAEGQWEDWEQLCEVEVDKWVAEPRQI